MKETREYLFEVGERIRECRKKAGISQEELAEQIGVNNNTIYRAESGMYAVSIDTFFAIAEVLKVPLIELCPERFTYIRRRPELAQLEFQFVRLNEGNKKVVYETSMTLINMLNVKQRERW